jgi:hypothetical protein
MHELFKIMSLRKYWNTFDPITQSQTEEHQVGCGISNQNLRLSSTQCVTNESSASDHADDMPAFTVLTSSNKYIQRFSLHVKEMVIKFRELLPGNPLDNVEYCLQDLIDYLTAGMKQ